jgi:hypothetical protein
MPTEKTTVRGTTHSQGTAGVTTEIKTSTAGSQTTKHSAVTDPTISAAHTTSTAKTTVGSVVTTGHPASTVIGSTSGENPVVATELFTKMVTEVITQMPITQLVSGGPTQAVSKENTTPKPQTTTAAVSTHQTIEIQTITAGTTSNQVNGIKTTAQTTEGQATERQTTNAMASESQSTASTSAGSHTTAASAVTTAAGALTSTQSSASDTTTTWSAILSATRLLPGQHVSLPGPSPSEAASTTLSTQASTKLQSSATTVAAGTKEATATSASHATESETTAGQVSGSKTTAGHITGGQTGTTVNGGQSTTETEWTTDSSGKKCYYRLDLGFAVVNVKIPFCNDFNPPDNVVANATKECVGKRCVEEMHKVHPRGEAE